MGTAGEKAELAEVHRMILMVQLGVCYQRPRCGRTLKGRAQGCGTRLENRGIRRLAVPTCAHKGAAAVLGHHQFQNGRFHIRAVVFGVPVGEGHGVRSGLGHIVAREGKARGVERVAASGDAFLGTDGQGQVTPHQITPIGVDRIERATALKPVEHLRTDALMNQQVQGWVGEQLGGQGHRPVSTPQAIQEHPCYSLAGGDFLLLSGYQTGINQTNAPDVFDNSGQ
jgi:hypothetical protein